MGEYLLSGFMLSINKISHPTAQKTNSNKSDHVEGYEMMKYLFKLN